MPIDRKNRLKPLPKSAHYEVGYGSRPEPRGSRLDNPAIKKVVQKALATNLLGQTV